MGQVHSIFCIHKGIEIAIMEVFVAQVVYCVKRGLGTLSREHGLDAMAHFNCFVLRSPLLSRSRTDESDKENRNDQLHCDAHLNLPFHAATFNAALHEAVSLLKN